MADREKLSLIPLGIIFLIFLLLWNYTGRSPAPTMEELLGGVHEHPELVETARSLEQTGRQIIKVTEGVHVATGYAISNSILVEGPEGLIIVDTTESEEMAAEILVEFRKISKKPIVAIIFTHHHGDHTTGAPSFIEDEHNPPDIWAHETFEKCAKKSMIVGSRHGRGAVHQFGTSLGRHMITLGVGRRLVTGKGLSAKLPLSPTKLVHGQSMNVELAGLNITFIHVPGETPDHTGVWLPDRKVLLSADNMGKTFPNLYGIRGTAPRDTMTWHASLRKMRNLRANFLVPSHGTNQGRARDL